MKLTDKVRKILIEVKECFNINEPDNPGTFVRGDGVRYKEWSYIKCNNDTNKIWDKMLKLNPSK